MVVVETDTKLGRQILYVIYTTVKLRVTVMAEFVSGYHNSIQDKIVQAFTGQ
jgi:hypothetical protein